MRQPRQKGIDESSYEQSFWTNTGAFIQCVINQKSVGKMPSDCKSSKPVRKCQQKPLFAPVSGGDAQYTSGHISRNIRFAEVVPLGATSVGHYKIHVKNV